MEDKKTLFKTVIIAALGYFVDVYDLLLFSTVRTQSLLDIGVPQDQVFDVGIFVLNCQVVGVFIGGILLGILGDKKGRTSILFSSIIIYSLATFLNAFATTVEQYAFLRFIAGIGLAGELGVAVTLVSEILPKEIRGYGVMIIAAVGVGGAVAAGLVSEFFHWQTAYIIGGVMGFLLLILRGSIKDSLMFHEMCKTKEVTSKGNFFMFFTDKERFKKFILCFLMGVPVMVVVGIYVTFAPEVAQGMGIGEPVKANIAVMFCYLGLIFGDLASGSLSQYLKSRKKALMWFLMVALILFPFFLYYPWQSASAIYGMVFVLGLVIGYWAVMITTISEQFGTNLRSTASTALPNIVRSSLLLLTLGVKGLKPELGIINSCAVIGVGAVVIALLAVWGLEETYSKDLNFYEYDEVP